MTREQLLLAKSREKPKHSNKDPTQPKINFFFPKKEKQESTCMKDLSG